MKITRFRPVLTRALTLVAALVIAFPAAADLVGMRQLEAGVSGKPASGFSAFLVERNFKRTRDLGPGLQWGYDSSWNRYSYVENNPLSYTDPSGMCVWDGCILEIGLATAGAIIGAEVANTPTSRSDPTYENNGTAMFEGGLAGLAVAGAIDQMVPSHQPAEPEMVPSHESEHSPSDPVKNGPRVSRVRPVEGAGPHTGFKTDQSGKVIGYTEFDAQGRAVKRFRGSGKLHGGVKPPLILEPRKGKGPGSPPKVPRKPLPDELPRGYRDGK